MHARPMMPFGSFSLSLSVSLALGPVPLFSFLSRLGQRADVIKLFFRPDPRRDVIRLHVIAKHTGTLLYLHTYLVLVAVVVPIQPYRCKETASRMNLR